MRASATVKPGHRSHQRRISNLHGLIYRRKNRFTAMEASSPAINGFAACFLNLAPVPYAILNFS
jgi:hypothetical protein